MSNDSQTITLTIPKDEADVIYEEYGGYGASVNLNDFNAGTRCLIRVARRLHRPEPTEPFAMEWDEAGKRLYVRVPVDVGMSPWMCFKRHGYVGYFAWSDFREQTRPATGADTVRLFS